MVKLSREELENIVEQDLPGYKVSDESLTVNQTNSGQDSFADDASDQAEASTPEIQSLRMKYLGEKYLGSDSFESNDAVADSENELASSDVDADDTASDEIIAVKRESSTHPWDRSSRPKAAVISGSEKKVIGEQG